MKNIFKTKYKSIISSTFAVAATLIGQNVMAQNKVVGKIIDSGNQPLQFVSVALKQDSIFVSSSFSDSLGAFEITSKNNHTFSVLFYLVGYKQQEIFVSNAKDTVINLTLNQSDQNTLNEVSVVASIPRIEQKVDRLVFNIPNNITLIGANAIEVLRKTPLVTVGNTNIGIVGKSLVKIMINDRLIQLAGEDLYNYLKSIPANSIQRIEVITNPSAKYDASGNSGLINIKTIKNKQEGVLGNIQTVYEQRYYGTGELGGSLNINHKKTSGWLNANYRNGESRPLEKMNAQYPLQNVIQSVYRPSEENRFSFQTGVEQRINRFNVIELSYTGLLSKPNELAHGTTLIYGANNTLDSALQTKNIIHEKINSNDFNFNYKHDFDTTGKRITLNTDYFLYSNNKNQNLNTQTSNFFFPNYDNNVLTKSTAIQQIEIFTANIDYEQPLKNGGTINLGAKETYLNTDNNYNFYNNIGNEIYVNDTTRSNHFIYKEDTKALYISSSFSKWNCDMQFGLRGEYTVLTGNSLTLDQINRRNYFRLFPTVYFQKVITQNHIIRLNYGRRINRPDYESLNPFRYYVNAYQYSEGNPNLTPSYANNFELMYILKGKYIFGIQEQIVTNLFQQVPIVYPETQWIVYTRKNTGSSGALIAFAIIPFNLGNWFTSTNTISGFTLSQKAKYNDVNFSYNAFSYMFNSENQFVLNKKQTIFGDITFQYMAPSRNFIYNVSEIYSLDAGLKFNLLKKMLTIGISCADIFFTSNPTATSTESSQITPFSIKIINDSRIFRLSCNYKFGGGMAHRKKDKSNKEETERIK